jgi:hypothetical protein
VSQLHLARAISANVRVLSPAPIVKFQSRFVRRFLVKVKSKFYDLVNKFLIVLNNLLSLSLSLSLRWRYMR